MMFSQVKDAFISAIPTQILHTLRGSMFRPMKVFEGLFMAKERNIVSAKDVAAEIMRLAGPMTAMKLQKLVYYCQAWSLVWDELPFFNEQIEAWANGPIVPELYKIHRGQFEITKWEQGDPSKMKPYQKETIQSVLKFYGDKTGQWLSELTHQEDPWKNAREGLAPGERGDKPISHAAMAEYYSSL